MSERPLVFVDKKGSTVTVHFGSEIRFKRYSTGARAALGAYRIERAVENLRSPQSIQKAINKWLRLGRTPR